MTIHLFYSVKPKLRNYYGARPDVEETVENATENDLKELLKLFKNPYEYESRIDFSSGESYYIKRSQSDVNNGVFNVTYSRAWNSHDLPVSMTAKALKNRLVETDKKAVA